MFKKFIPHLISCGLIMMSATAQGVSPPEEEGEVGRFPSSQSSLVSPTPEQKKIEEAMPFFNSSFDWWVNVSGSPVDILWKAACNDILSHMFYSAGWWNLAGSPGLKPNDKSAFICFEGAAYMGHKNAQYEVGMSYLIGRGVEKDNTKAFLWFKYVADQGHEAARYEVGMSYLRGRGVEKDHKKAMFYFNLAACQGHKGAQHEAGW